MEEKTKLPKAYMRSAMGDDAEDNGRWCGDGERSRRQHASVILRGEIDRLSRMLLARQRLLAILEKSTEGDGDPMEELVWEMLTGQRQRI